MPDEDPPLRWTMRTYQVEFIWNKTRENFENKLWFEAMMYARGGLPAEWQEELLRRSGHEHIVDVLMEAVEDLRDPDPSLVYLALHDAFDRYGITLEVMPHPIHGDVLARARDLVEAGVSHPENAAVTWPLGADCVAELWRLIDLSRRDDRQIADALGEGLGARRADELSLRCGEELRLAVHLATNDLGAGTDPSVVLWALREWFASPDHGQVTLEFAAHPEHGDVLARAGRLTRPA